MKQTENFSFLQGVGSWKCLRLGISFFWRQLAHLLKPLGRFTCTVKPYPERLRLHCSFKPASTRATQQRSSVLSCSFPLLSWNDTNLHIAIQNIRSRNWLRWKLIPLCLPKKLLLSQFSLHRYTNTSTSREAEMSIFSTPIFDFDSPHYSPLL